MSDEIDSHKSAISFLTFFQKSIQAVAVVKPGKVSFDFPTLPTVTLLMFIFRRPPFGNRHVILTILGIRHDSTFPQFSSEWFAIVAFVETQAFRTTNSLPDFDAIYRFQNVDLVMTIRFAQCEVQWIPICIYHQVAFEAVNTVLS